MKATHGWTVVARGGGRLDPKDDDIFVYMRDCPADEAHFCADLAPFTFPTKREAQESGKNGHYAYKRC